MAITTLPAALAELVEGSSAPHLVELALVQLVDDQPGLPDRLAGEPDLARALVAVLGASRSLTRLCRADHRAIDVLGHLDRRPPPDWSSPGALSGWKHLELARIAARDLMGLDELEEVGRGLSDLADDVLSGALVIAQEGAGRADPLAVIGMGKLGAQELNYASDIDVVFVAPEGNGGEGRGREGRGREEGDVEALGRQVMAVARGCWRVDAGLRPEGRDGSLARSVSSYQAYWERWAQPWEAQALLKARTAAGDPQLGNAFERAAADWVWGRPFGAEDLRQLRTMKERAERDLASRGLTQREIKRGRGGIRDVEFAVQLLQMVHGRADPGLRLRATLPALAELARAGYVRPGDATDLSNAYRFLRLVEHRLQLVEEAQVHTVPGEAGARNLLARVLGYRDNSTGPTGPTGSTGSAGSALSRFDADLSRHQAIVRSIHERLFFRPLLEAFTGPAAGQVQVMGADAAIDRLAAFGFTDAARARAAVEELTRGLTRSSRLMSQMLPLLLGWLSETPDPDLGLLGLRTLACRGHLRDRMIETFRDSPEAARRLCQLVGTSRLLLVPIERNPDLLGALGHPRPPVRRARAELVDAAMAAGRAGGPASRPAGLFRFQQRERFAIAARDVLGSEDEPAGVGACLTDLAEATLEAALASLEPAVPLAVVAMGSFGGAELSYASDLDILLVFDEAPGAGAQDAEAPEAEKVASALIRMVNGTTPAERIFTLDAGLRPEGRQGPLARSLHGYRFYYSRWAKTWERQALVRARVAAGDQELGQRFMSVVDDFVWSSPLDDEGQRDVRRMKARVERERIPPGEDPQFHLKLGRGSLADVEWTTQLLQLRHGVRSASTLRAISALAASGHLEAADGEALSRAHSWLSHVRNRLCLVRGTPTNSLPTQAGELGRLARSLELSPSALRDQYRQLTRRARAVTERLFYGIDPRPPSRGATRSGS